MKEKFEQPENENQKRSDIVSNSKRKIIKPAVFKLTGKTIDKNITFLLKLGPMFVMTPKSIPYMEIITAIESRALKLLVKRILLQKTYSRLLVKSQIIPVERSNKIV